VQYFADDDFTMANCEVCFTESTAAVAKTFTFKTSADYAQVFPNGSVEFVTLANNHVLDYGQQGYDDTKAALDAVGVRYAGRDEWTVYETARGLKIGLCLSFGTGAQIRAGSPPCRRRGRINHPALHFGDEGAIRSTATRAPGPCRVDAGGFRLRQHPHTLEPMESTAAPSYLFDGQLVLRRHHESRDKDTFILHSKSARPDGTVTIAANVIIPCASCGRRTQQHQPVPYARTTRLPARAEKLSACWTGNNPFHRLRLFGQE
jgi:poly-gamma-glutamate synthesis protein (capsule biosynthesis protein)